MVKVNNTGKALLASVMSMVLCLTMLLGTTLAWFTDEASNNNNRITTGTLDVQLLKYVGTGYADISGGSGNIFNDGTVTEENATVKNVAEATLWEPNKTEVVLLQVKNNGNLALDYNINLVITPDEGQTANLENVMKYAIISNFDANAYRGEAAEGADVTQKDILTAAGITSWDYLLNFSGVEQGYLPIGEVKAAPNGALEAGKSDYFLLAVHMDASANNDYQGLGLTIDVNVDAKQQDFEADSFGTEYDKDALWEQEPQGEPAIPDEYLNTNLFKNSGFDAGLVSDSCDGWVLFDHDRDGDVSVSDNGLIETAQSDDNNYLRIGFTDEYAYGTTTHNCGGTLNTQESTHNVIPGAYQTVDLANYFEDLTAISNYDFTISAKYKFEVSDTKIDVRIYVECLNKDGEVLTEAVNAIYAPGVQALRDLTGATTWTDVTAPATLVEGTTKVNVYLACGDKSKGTNAILNLDDVQFIITKK